MTTRKFSRVQFNVSATIKTAAKQFKGSVENLSMRGMFLITDERLSQGETVEITIMLAGVEPEIAVNFSGEVARVADDGIAFNFNKVDLESYMHLKNIIAYNMDDPEKVIEEIGNSIEEKLAEVK